LTKATDKEIDAIQRAQVPRNSEPSGSGQSVLSLNTNDLEYIRDSLKMIDELLMVPYSLECAELWHRIQQALLRLKRIKVDVGRVARINAVASKIS